jgi:glycosyltransferase involved in cell wall biosynthesis
MRFLMVCMQFPTEGGHSYMTTELADALVAAGHEVEILFYEWNAPANMPVEQQVTANGIRVVHCAPRMVSGFGSLIRKASKFLLGGRHAAAVARRHFNLASFDTFITWMPAVAVAPLVKQAIYAGIPHRLLYIWDFFPWHQREIGLMPGGPLFHMARRSEEKLLGTFTAIFCTLPGNATYLRSRYPVRPEQRVIVTPIWSEISRLPPVDRTAMRAHHSLPASVPIAVFGGLFVEGRGFEQMMDAAGAAEAAGSSLLFLFIGDGRLAPMLRARAAMQTNVCILPPLPRDAYLALLTACDVGMIATVPGVSSFAIPTKTIDYLRAGLPVIAAVEHGSDFPSILERYRVGASVPFRDPDLFWREVARLATDPAARAAAADGARSCLEEVFDVRHAVAAISEAVRP